jgi:hypothetical protein
MRLGLSYLRLGCLCPLLAKCLGLLLLLRAWSGGSIDGTGFEIHGRDEGPCELLLSDERVQFCLLGRPSL